MTGDQFNPQSLKTARQFRGLTQAEVADAVGVSQAYIGQIEGGRVPRPTSDFVGMLAGQLGVAPAYFFSPVPDDFRETECHFRKRASLGAKLKAMALARGTLYAQVIHAIEQMVDLPEVALPRCAATTELAIEQATEELRRKRGLPIDCPIGNMVQLAESCGVFVVDFDGETAKLDAFSRMGVRPIAVRSTAVKSASRSRFTLAHELGHLVIHHEMETGDNLTERQADRFASALLLPRCGFRGEFPASEWSIDWAAIWKMKVRWGASGAAIIRRARDLGLLSDRLYKGGCIYLRKMGYHLGEPHEPPEEKPGLLGEIVEMLDIEGGTSFDELAKLAGLTAETLEAVTGLKRPIQPEVDADLASRLIPFPGTARHRAQE